MVKTLPFADIQVPTPGFGCMGLNHGFGYNYTLEEAEPVLLKAIELGCTFWDTAVIYHAGMNEKLIGDFFRKHDLRDKVFIASKCGFNTFNEDGTPGDGRLTNSASHIKRYIEGTTERLGSAPDLYYLHRIDPDTPLEESIPALDEIRKAGKTKYIGLSECSAATLRKANSIAKIDAVQAEYSPFETVHETNGLIDTARELGVAFVAFSPLGRGWLVDDCNINTPDDFPPNDFRRKVPKFQGENFHKNRAIRDEIRKLAARKGCKTTQIALAWVAEQGLIAIPGTTKPHRLEENWASRDIVLTAEEKKELRRIIEEAKPVGDRNGTSESIKSIISNLNAATLDSNTEVVVAPPAVYLGLARSVADSKIGISAQNVFDRANGAFTGETSVSMLKDLGVNWTLTGHSERRVILKETDEFIAAKTKFAIDNGVNVILCIGETLEERESGATMQVCERQLNAAAAVLSAADWAHVVIAYEPVWAIGTGKVATTTQAQEVHAEIRKWLAAKVSAEAADNTRIIYGGSVTDANCKDLAKEADIDGFLVGGASLKPAFVDIVNAKL
ncbi:Triosephosphate isomerase [Ascosphaera apis ARSEF 7405]|uniref:Triosephosphate isomerase n=1 Tax=Ascosphaera apis ARSEF 7405 TaxID=392613 RepID=A0A167ZUG8_9EURO|nr:Triosephosphate isomerase [Ascosphaera apis ARSEF 7405]